MATRRISLLAMILLAYSQAAYSGLQIHINSFGVTVTHQQPSPHFFEEQYYHFHKSRHKNHRRHKQYFPHRVYQKSYHKYNGHNDHGYRDQPFHCWPVEKRGNWRGHSALIGGTMCKDGYGQPFIKRGSRYLIAYLYY